MFAPILSAAKPDLVAASNAFPIKSAHAGTSGRSPMKVSMRQV
jgi:hypothetical protein